MTLRTTTQGKIPTAGSSTPAPLPPLFFFLLFFLLFLSPLSCSACDVDSDYSTVTISRLQAGCHKLTDKISSQDFYYQNTHGKVVTPGVEPRIEALNLYCRSKPPPLATKNLLEDADRLRRPLLMGGATQSISDLSMR